MSHQIQDDHSESAQRPRRRQSNAEVEPEYRMPETDDIIRRVMEIIDSSPGLPMSSSVRVNKEEVIEMLADALDRMPAEVRQAKWLLKDRDAFVASKEREGDSIIAEASASAARLVDRKEIVKAAQAKADQMIAEAEKVARRRQREADDYCDQQLARYENALGKMLKQVSRMRDRLAAPTIEEAELGSAPQRTPQRPRGTPATNRRDGGTSPKRSVAAPFDQDR